MASITANVCVCVTSVLLETDTVMPFSLGMLLELLFGELGPEPGALLHAESETRADTQIKHTNQTHKKPAAVWNETLSEPFACLLPAMSSERFLALVMGLSRRRSSGLLLRSLTFCFSRERSFRLGSDAERRLKRDQILFLKSNLNSVIVSA